MLKMISGDEMCSSICGKARCIEKIKDSYYSCANYFPVAQAQLKADIYEYGKLEQTNVKLYADLKEQVEVCKSCKEYFEFNRLNKVIENMGNRIKELNEDWKATLKVASNKKLSDILLDKENMVEITPEEALMIADAFRYLGWDGCDTKKADSLIAKLKGRDAKD